MLPSDRLSAYPYVVVRVACPYCDRAGEYRLARLAAKYGAEIPLDELLERLAFDCQWRRPPGDRPPGKYDPECGAAFVDLAGAPRPPDLPPAMSGLRVVKGGKA